MQYFITLIISIGIVVESFTQPLTIDTTFQPFFDIRCCGAFAGSISDILEDPESGKLYVVGAFNFNTPPPNQEFHGGITSMSRNGNRNYNFKGSGNSDGFAYIIPFNNTLMLYAHGNILQIDSSGQVLNWTWRSNIWKNIKCPLFAFHPHFFSDGSSFNTLPKPPRHDSCIITPSSNYLHQYIIKVDPQGFWDSTFTHDANYHVNGFIPYDSNRIFVYGLPAYLTHYNGIRVNGLFRIFEDGTLDTTFKVILSDTLSNASRVTHIKKDGSFFLVGNFFLEEYPGQRFYVAKFHADGSLDTSFKIEHNFKELNYVLGINNIVSTPDGGYIVAGGFDSIQGYRKHNLAKLDSLGNLEPQYFNTHGPDTSHWLGAGRESITIEKSAFGGYYVYGDFISWNGMPSQPIVRLKEITTGIHEIKKNELKAQIYPNPSRGMISIATETTLQSIEIYNLQGQKIQNINPNKRSLKMAKESGVYILLLQDTYGRIYSKKIIKH